jgi:AcrR family transcriptional regulator
MPRSPEDNQQLKDARRTDILRAATRVFAKKGFAETKISDVAKEAGLSHGLVYHYFENKDAVFQAILEDKLAHSRRVMEEDDSLPGGPLDRMRASVANWLERVQEDPAMALVITQALVTNALTPESRSMMREHMREAFESATERIAEGQRRGEIGTHASPSELATFLMCFMRGLSFMMLFDYGPSFSIPRVDTLLRVMLPDSELRGLSAATSSPRPRRHAARVARIATAAAPASKKTKKKAPARKAAR